MILFLFSYFTFPLQNNTLFAIIIKFWSHLLQSKRQLVKASTFEGLNTWNKYEIMRNIFWTLLPHAFVTMMKLEIIW